MIAYHRPLKAIRSPGPSGIVYASKAEARRADELEILRRAGQIGWVLRQVPIDLGPADRFRVDFVVAEPFGGSPLGLRVHGEDVCCVVTREKRRVMRLWAVYGPFPLRILTGGGLEIIEPGNGG
jgi:hypothetical protein